MIDEVCSQILLNKPPKYDFEQDMLAQNMIMDAALKSSVENKAILLYLKPAFNFFEDTINVGISICCFQNATNEATPKCCQKFDVFFPKS